MAAAAAPATVTMNDASLQCKHCYATYSALLAPVMLDCGHSMCTPCAVKLEGFAIVASPCGYVSKPSPPISASAPGGPPLVQATAAVAAAPAPIAASITVVAAVPMATVAAVTTRKKRDTRSKTATEVKAATRTVISISCPTCAATTKLPAAGAAALPANGDLRAVLAKQAADDGDAKNACGSECGAIAEIHCFDCIASFCTKCHSKAAFAKHTKVPLSEAAKRGTKCLKHKKELDLWCSTDEQLICLMCHSHGEHKGHTSKPIDEYAETARKQLSDSIATISTSMTRVQRAINDVDTRRDQINRSYTIGDAQLSQSEAMLIAAVRDRFAALKAECKSIVDPKVASLSAQSDALRLTPPLLTDLSARTKLALQDRHPVDVAASSHDAIHAFKKLMPSDHLLIPLRSNSMQISIDTASLMNAITTFGRVFDAVEVPFRVEEKITDIFHWLGTNHGRASWSNPVTNNMITMTSSGTHNGNVQHLLSPRRDGFAPIHVPRNQAWHIMQSSSVSLSEWQLQASDDGNIWHALDRRESSLQQLKAAAVTRSAPSVTSIIVHNSDADIEKVTFPIASSAASSNKFYHYYRLASLSQATQVTSPFEHNQYHYHYITHTPPSSIITSIELYGSIAQA